MLGKWIYYSNKFKKDTYSVYKVKIKTKSKYITLKISADTNYCVYLNKKIAGFGQYACYPYCPTVDTIKIKINREINDIFIVLYYLGDKNFSTYYLDKPGIVFDIFDEDNMLIAKSDEKTLSMESKFYINGKCSIITPQLGYRNFIDGREDLFSGDYHKSVLVNKNVNFVDRPNKKLVLRKMAYYEIVKKEKNLVIIDLKKESTGFITFKLNSPTEQNLIISFGEHLKDGTIRKIIENRNFSFEYFAKKGMNSHVFSLRRCGLRYIQIEFKDEIDLKYLSILPTEYPFKKKIYNLGSEIHQKIFNTCVYTLECCYHEHFEDCPWREQALYVLDSYNQLSCHFIAFKNREQIKSSLALIYNDKREKLLSITYPSSFKLAIPSFSLFFFIEMEDYYKRSKDKVTLSNSFNKLLELYVTFKDNMSNGLENEFLEDNVWNFYEWESGLDYPSVEAKTDLIINELFIIALMSFKNICKWLNKTEYTDEINSLIKVLRKNTRKTFFNKKDRLFFMSNIDKRYSVLGNSLAILSKVANKKDFKNIENNIKNNKDLVQTTLSMKRFYYDALLMIDKNNKDYILNDIEKTYSFMLNDGATTFYETIKGDKDFNNAGSLCHGWSAIPILYYKKFGMVK